MDQIVSILLPEDFSSYKGDDGNSLDILDRISNVNIFVGSNNSGKSRFMRLMARQPDYQVRISDVDLDQINAQVRDAMTRLADNLRQRGLEEVNDIAVNTVERLQEPPTSLKMSNDVYQQWRETLTRWAGTSSISRTTSNSIGRHYRSDSDNSSLVQSITSLSNEALVHLNHIPIHSKVTLPKKVYIPILRGLRPLDDQYTDLYASRTKQDYFDANDSNPDVFTGLSLYQRLIDLLLGDNAERRIIAEYQRFISKTLFEGKPVTLIPNQRSKIVIVKIGNEKEQPIYHLGDGIQSVIILSFLPFVMRESTFFFIEEPELHLHPGLQRKILNFFAAQKQHTFFLTTHSNHLLDMTMDIRETTVYTFGKRLGETEDNEEQIPTFTIEIVDTGHSSSLELLGVRNSSVFLVNATIWVEGITDRWYLRAMLNSYVQHLDQLGKLDLKIEEDVHYSFVEYGGANITHWSFLDYEEHPIEVDRLCARALVVVDQDGSAKLKRKEDLQAKLGDRLIVLPVREIENLLPYDIIKSIVSEYEDKDETSLPDFEYDMYKDEYLGVFIEREMLTGNIARKGGYREKSGTLKAKVDFCERAIDKIDYENLSIGTQQVIRSIYNFITNKNT